MTLACTIAAALILLAGLFAVIVERTTERDEARDAARKLGEELDAERDVRRRTEAAFAEFQASVSSAGGRVVLPLRPVADVIPLQRDGSDEWPKIARTIGIETSEPS